MWPRRRATTFSGESREPIAFAQSRTHAILVRVFSAVTTGVDVRTAKTSAVVIEAIGIFAKLVLMSVRR